MFFSFFKKVLFGCASLAARKAERSVGEQHPDRTQQTPSQTATRGGVVKPLSRLA